MLNNKRSSKMLMKESFGGRSLIELEELFPQFESEYLSLDRFLRVWEDLANTLKYPDPRQMRPDDDLMPVMELNNSSLFYSDFEDAYEILQAIDIDVFHAAIDMRCKLNTIKDLMTALSPKWAAKHGLNGD